MLPAEINFTHFSLDFNMHYTQKRRVIAGMLSKSTVIKQIIYICKPVQTDNILQLQFIFTAI